MTLSDDLRVVAQQLSELEKQFEAQRTMLNSVLDLHNDLTDWATDAADERSATEVMGILEMYVQKSKVKGSRTTTASNSSDVTVSAG